MNTRVPLAVLAVVSAVSRGFAQQPFITEQPQNQTNLIGTTATFAVGVSGTVAYQWLKNGSSLVNGTDATLVLTNVQTSHAGGYSVVVTNLEGAATSQVAYLRVVSLPTGFVQSLALYQRMAVYRGSNTSLTVSSSGTAPLSYQWRLEGQDLLGQTNKILTIAAAEPDDEGDYTVLVTNSWGSFTSAPARLFVTPPAAQYVRSDFTNQAGLRLPYFLLKPESFDPSRTYPLVCVLHGTPGDETLFQNYVDIGPQAIGAVYASYAQQQKDPCIVVWPARVSGDSGWTPQYVQQILGLLDWLAAESAVDTNRIYILGMSEGVHAVWDCLCSRPNFFAGAVVLAGWAGDGSAGAIKRMPLWAFCAADDSLAVSTRDLVRTLRQIGANVIYTEYRSGGHMDGIAMGLCTPTAVDWLLAQRRGERPLAEPLVSITEPTSDDSSYTGGSLINLSGSCAALGQGIYGVSWTNFANNARGVATGTNFWSATCVPLKTNQLNLVINPLIVVGTTTSWASPGFGGTTTFNDSLAVFCAPIRLTATRQGTNLLLNWTGGGPPFRVQRANDLPAGQWSDFLPDINPPLLIPDDGAAGFFRVIGH